MALFCIVDISIPSPMYPTPSPKNQYCSLDPQVFLLQQTTLIRGWEELTSFNRMKKLMTMNEIVDESTGFRQVCQPQVDI